MDPSELSLRWRRTNEKRNARCKLPIKTHRRAEFCDKFVQS